MISTAMLYKQTTQVPNVIFDVYLPQLTESEIKILLIIIRQTWGWVERISGKRKTRDRMTNTQLQQKTGLSKRIVTKAIQSLVSKSLIQVTDFRGNILYNSSQRRGKSYLYFGMNMPLISTQLTSAKSAPKLVYKSVHNKTNYSKLISADMNVSMKHIRNVLPSFNDGINNPSKKHIKNL